jgi:CheY-like chemotaxis protein
VAKILVADDNSNIQKMVGLALKDQGIEVVAVGNGEAAVRKISDIRPDLVLADVFMPVRNGYEVCQYVKQDASLAHIPVILLVGAFDPLDEQEAQRVGADGVLKKPFVPPDPLIAMVKAALARAGVTYSAEKNAAIEQSKERRGADLLAPRPMSVAPPVVLAPPVAPPESISMEDMDGLVYDAPPAPVKIEGGAPLAFGNLMEAGNAVEDDPGFLPPVHPELAGERDWRATEEEADVPEEEEEEKPKASWRRDAAEDEVAEEVGGGAVGDWRDTAFNEPPTRKSARENWGAAEPLPAMTEAAAVKDIGPASMREAATVAPIQAGTNTSGADALPQVPAFSADTWASAIAAGEPERAASAGDVAQTFSKNGSHLLTAENAPASDAAAAELPGAATLAVEHEAVATAIDRFAGSRDAQGDTVSPSATSTWEVQAMKANLLAATWDAPVAEVAGEHGVVAEVAAPDAAVADRAVAEPAFADAEPAAMGEQAAEVPASVLESTNSEGSFVSESARVAETADVTSERIAEELAATPTEVAAPIFEPAGSGELAAVVPEAQNVTEPAPSEEPAQEIPVAQHESATSEHAALAQDHEAHAHVAVPEESVAQHAVEGHPAEASAALADVAAVTESVVASVYAEAPAAGEAAEQAEAPAVPSHIAAADASNAVNRDVVNQDAVNQDVVARVLASLSPEVMQAVTRELLKPVVEAMVREELNKKK